MTLVKAITFLLIQGVLATSAWGDDFDLNSYCELVVTKGAEAFARSSTNQGDTLLAARELYDGVVKTSTELNRRAIEALESVPAIAIFSNSIGNRSERQMLMQIIFALPSSAVAELNALMKSGRDAEITQEFAEAVKRGRGPFYKSLPYWTGFVLGFSAEVAMFGQSSGVFPVTMGILLRSVIAKRFDRDRSAKAGSNVLKMIEEQQRLAYLEDHIGLILGPELTYDELQDLVQNIIRRGKVMDDVLRHAVKIGLIKTAAQYIELVHLYKQSLSGEFEIFVKELELIRPGQTPTFELLNPTEAERTRFDDILG